MDRSWIDCTGFNDRQKPQYQKGVTVFLNLHLLQLGREAKYSGHATIVRIIFSLIEKWYFTHLFMYGILRDYKQ